MKQYQVTKKLQVTIPKKLAQRLGITPGDSVVFDEANGEITLRKVGRPHRNAKEVELALREFASDMERLTPYVRQAKRTLNENLSRYLRAK